MNEITAFMQLYLYQLERILHQDMSPIASINFQLDEANTDKELKQALKSLMLKHNRIDNPIDIEYCDSETIRFYATNLNHYIIENIFLSAELTSQHKEIVKSQKAGVYTNPDLFLQITNGAETHHLSIELKSTKNDRIPGSSIQQVSPYEWVIFVQHKQNQFKVITGQYINSITSRLPFPDRSPRPEVGFNILSDWNMRNRTFSKDGALCINNDTKDNELKLSILDDWHSYLVAEWLEVVKNSSLEKNGGKWFNHTIRLFSLDLLSYYNTLSDNEKETLYDNLRKSLK